MGINEGRQIDNVSPTSSASSEPIDRNDTVLTINDTQRANRTRWNTTLNHVH